MADSNTTRNARRDLYAIFDRVIETYVDKLLTPYERSFSYDGRVSPTLTPSSPSSNYKIDTEIAVRRALGETPELIAEWNRLVAQEYDRQTGQRPDSKPSPPTREQRELTHRTVSPLAKIFQRRKLDSPSYFTTIRRKSEAA